VSRTPLPFPNYNTFYGYYGAVYPVAYSPGYLKEEKKRIRIGDQSVRDLFSGRRTRLDWHH
jgi:hypothetical protein